MAEEKAHLQAVALLHVRQPKWTHSGAIFTWEVPMLKNQVSSVFKKSFLLTRQSKFLHY